MCTSAGHFFLLLLGASCAAAAPVHTRTQTGLEHEDVTLDGWVLDEVFVYHPHEDPSSDLLTLTRRKLSFNNNPHLAPESRRRRLVNTDGDSFTPTNLRAELSCRCVWRPDTCQGARAGENQLCQQDRGGAELTRDQSTQAAGRCSTLRTKPKSWTARLTPPHPMSLQFVSKR